MIFEKSGWNELTKEGQYALSEILSLEGFEHCATPTAGTSLIPIANMNQATDPTPPQSSQSTCSSCGAEYIPGEMLFCRECGNKLPENFTSVDEVVSITDAESPTASNEPIVNASITQGETVFARWKKKPHFYPATVERVDAIDVKVSYLNGNKGVVSLADIIDIDDAFDILQFQGNWNNAGIYFKGKVTRGPTLTMNYEDGDVEEVELHQLRGILKH